MCASAVQFLSINDPDYCYYYHISARYWINSVWLLACILLVCLSVRPSVPGLSTCLRICSFSCLCLCASVCLFGYLSVRLTVCSAYPSVCLPAYLPACLSVPLSVRLSVCVFVFLAECLIRSDEGRTLETSA